MSPIIFSAWEKVTGLTECQKLLSRLLISDILFTLAHKRGDKLMWSVAHKRSKSRYVVVASRVDMHLRMHLLWEVRLAATA